MDLIGQRLLPAVLVVLLLLVASADAAGSIRILSHDTEFTVNEKSSVSAGLRRSCDVTIVRNVTIRVESSVQDQYQHYVHEAPWADSITFESATASGTTLTSQMWGHSQGSPGPEWIAVFLEFEPVSPPAVVSFSLTYTAKNLIRSASDGLVAGWTAFDSGINARDPDILSIEALSLSWILPKDANPQVQADPSTWSSTVTEVGDNSVVLSTLIGAVSDPPAPKWSMNMDKFRNDCDAVDALLVTLVVLASLVAVGFLVMVVVNVRKQDKERVDATRQSYQPAYNDKGDRE